MLRRSVQRFLLVLAAVAGPVLAAATPLWFDEGLPTTEARHAVDVLLSAADQGLEPRDYDAAPLDRWLTQAFQVPVLAQAEQAQLDAALTAALQRYLTDLQVGRVDPRQIHADFDLEPRPAVDTGAFLRDAVTARRVLEALREAQPRLPMYASLRESLARYRALADQQAWQVPLPSLPGRKLVPGQAYVGLAVLAQRLRRRGRPARRDSRAGAIRGRAGAGAAGVPGTPGSRPTACWARRRCSS